MGSFRPRLPSRIELPSAHAGGAALLAVLVGFWLGASVGVSFVLENALLIWQGNHFNAIDPILPHGRILTVGGISYSWDKLIVLLIVFSLLLGLDWLLRRTRYGHAIRAVSQDREA